MIKKILLAVVVGFSLGHYLGRQHEAKDHAAYIFKLTEKSR